MKDDLVEAVATALCEADGADWYAHSFATTPNGQTPEEMRSGYRDIARAIIPIVRADEREESKHLWAALEEARFQILLRADGMNVEQARIHARAWINDARTTIRERNGHD